MNALQITPSIDPPASLWPARTTIKRTFRAMERWIEDRKGSFSGNEYQIAREALHAVGALDQSNAEKMPLIVATARAWGLAFIETFNQHPRSRLICNQPNG